MAGTDLSRKNHVCRFALGCGESRSAAGCATRSGPELALDEARVFIWDRDEQRPGGREEWRYVSTLCRGRDGWALGDCWAGVGGAPRRIGGFAALSLSWDGERSPVLGDGRFTRGQFLVAGFWMAHPESLLEFCRYC